MFRKIKGNFDVRCLRSEINCRLAKAIAFDISMFYEAAKF